MASILRKIASACNHLLVPTGVCIVRVRDIEWFRHIDHFFYRGRKFYNFYHRLNCGWPPLPPTERSVELALADSWLTAAEPSKVWKSGPLQVTTGRSA